MEDEKNKRWAIFWIFISNMLWLTNSNPYVIDKLNARHGFKVWAYANL